jgi:hypothetical protein
MKITLAANRCLSNFPGLAGRIRRWYYWAMGLSLEETKAARQALREIGEYDVLRKPWFWLGQLFLPLSLILNGASTRHRLVFVFNMVIVAMLFILFFMNLISCRRRLETLRSRYAANLQLLKNLGGEGRERSRRLHAFGEARSFRFLESPTRKAGPALARRCFPQWKADFELATKVWK